MFCHFQPGFPGLIVEIMIFMIPVVARSVIGIIAVIAVTVRRRGLFRMEVYAPAVHPAVQLVLHLLVCFTPGSGISRIIAVVITVGIRVCLLLRRQRSPVYHIGITWTGSRCRIGIFLCMGHVAVFICGVIAAVDLNLGSLQHFIRYTVVLGHGHFRLYFCSVFCGSGHRSGFIFLIPARARFATAALVNLHGWLLW